MYNFQPPVVTRLRVSLGRSCRSIIIPQWSVKVDVFCIQEVNHILTKSLLLEHEHVLSLTCNFPIATQVIGKDTKQSDPFYIVKVKFSSFLKKRKKKEKVLFSLFHCLNNIQFSSYHWSQALQNEWGEI